MDVENLFDLMPFNRELGIDITHAEPGHATGRLELADRHSSNPRTQVAHGGVAYALADTAGGAAVIAAVRDIAPTIDMRIDYLKPATGGVMLAEADAVRIGESVATVDVTVTDGDDRTLATARGTYKTGGDATDSAWSEGEPRLSRDDEDEPSGI
jgi:uncharacterized protein (TIGR00369 family)